MRITPPPKAPKVDWRAQRAQEAVGDLAVLKRAIESVESADPSVTISTISFRGGRVFVHYFDARVSADLRSIATGLVALAKSISVVYDSEMDIPHETKLQAARGLAFAWRGLLAQAGL